MSRRTTHRRARRLPESSEDSEDTSARSETSGYDSSASERDEDDSGSSEDASSRASKKRKKRRSRPRKHRNKRQKKRYSRRKSRRSRRHSLYMASDVESEVTAEKSESAASVSTHLGEDNSPDVPSQESVRAPELDVKLFASWGELESYLSSYSRRTYQVCHIYISDSATGSEFEPIREYN
ncbi:Nop53 (60S ribosomal biogenesis) [Phytophthora infestans]|uniref:Nop53 (60S ribosomal biogenesis) n=1 Tax=Phytophthora infestans TaxID=4787 RepID=A0A8S9UEB2_PHYIN|nr:Nop53 (60S ribosomal biogenesis) [Phytophthora infestans]